MTKQTSKINVSDVHRELIKNYSTPFSHNDVKKLIEGTKGKFSNKEIRFVRKYIKTLLTEIDTTLEKLENQL